MTESSTDRRTHTTDHIPLDADGFVFLENEVVDSLVSTVLELTAEVWTVKRRLLVMDKVMSAQGAIDRDAVETYLPTAEDEAEWRSLREQYVKRILGPMARKVTLAEPAPLPPHPFTE